MAASTVAARPLGPLRLEAAPCCICGEVNGDPVAVGEDFEYHCSPDAFLVVRCPRCRLARLDPRPALSELSRIYPDDYHAFAFTEANFGLVHRVRERLEARRLLRFTRAVPRGGRILDVGCGDGFHLDLLRRFGPQDWELCGVDLDERAVSTARARGLAVELGDVGDGRIPEQSIDLVLLIQTIEHVANPVELLRSIGTVLRPGGELVVVTDNIGSLDARLFRQRHWGGYHFPRHWTLFDEASLRRAADTAGLEVAKMRTIVSPVNWTYSVRNSLEDLHAPRWLVERFSLASPVALGVFTVWDGIHNAAGNGALLCATMRRPR